MNRVFAVAAMSALLCLGNLAQADVFNLGSGLTNLETVRVGDPENVGELSGAGAGGYGPDKVCGSVSYTYNIGKYEVTTAQYCDFLNHKAKSDPYGLWNSSMADITSSHWIVGCNIQRRGTLGNYSYTVGNGTTDVLFWGNRPVCSVSYWDSCRFANWLNNGQGNGDTETGAYTLNGYNGDVGTEIARNAGAKWALASEDEWYKAAYYKGGGRNAGYWDYPTRSSDRPSNEGSDGYTDPGNHVNYFFDYWTIGYPYYRTNVGEFENSASPYGTFDQGGNVSEWTEAIVSVDSAKSYREMRGGSAFDYPNYMRAAGRGGMGFSCPTQTSIGLGFRVVAVPEPRSIIPLAIGIACLLGLFLRR